MPSRVVRCRVKITSKITKRNTLSGSPELILLNVDTHWVVVTWDPRSATPRSSLNRGYFDGANLPVLLYRCHSAGAVLPVLLCRDRFAKAALPVPLC